MDAKTEQELKDEINSYETAIFEKAKGDEKAKRVLQVLKRPPPPETCTTPNTFLTFKHEQYQRAAEELQVGPFAPPRPMLANEEAAALDVGGQVQPQNPPEIETLADWIKQTDNANLSNDSDKNNGTIVNDQGSVLFSYHYNDDDTFNLESNDTPESWNAIGKYINDNHPGEDMKLYGTDEQKLGMMKHFTQETFMADNPNFKLDQSMFEPSNFSESFYKAHQSEIMKASTDHINHHDKQGPQLKVT